MNTDILSCVVHTRPGCGQAVAGRIDPLPGVEVHAGIEVDKLVVTIEDTAEHRAADLLGELSQVPAVINTVLIYHYGGDDIEPRGAAGDRATE
jgi:nitrate reductase NapD